jgi:RNA-directed DNA polymerase
MHYAFDLWLEREFPTVAFERYADDAVIHCVSERQARHVLAALTNRMEEVGLQLHPAKTRIVYCKDGKRQGAYEHTAFTFLGYTFRARKNRDKHGRLFLSFDPGQQGRTEEDERAGPFLAPAHTLGPVLPRARPTHQPGRGGLDQLLRAVPPDGTRSAPSTHQRLLGALDPPEVQTVRGETEGPREAAGDRPAISADVRALASHRKSRIGLVIRATRAV